MRHSTVPDNDHYRTDDHHHDHHDHHDYHDYDARTDRLQGDIVGRLARVHEGLRRRAADSRPADGVRRVARRAKLPAAHGDAALQYVFLHRLQSHQLHAVGQLHLDVRLDGQPAPDAQCRH